MAYRSESNAPPGPVQVEAPHIAAGASEVPTKAKTPAEEDATQSEQTKNTAAHAAIAALEQRALDLLGEEQKFELYKRSAQETARITAADAVRDAISDAKLTLANIEERVGMPPSRVSEIATASGEHGPKLWSLCLIAKALNKRLRITFE